MGCRCRQAEFLLVIKEAEEAKKKREELGKGIVASSQVPRADLHTIDFKTLHFCA